MKPRCGRDWEHQLPAADLADSMELAQSCLCFFILHLPPTVRPPERFWPAEPHGLTAETLGFTRTNLSPRAGAAEQLLFRENRLQVARAADNFARFASNWPKRTEPGGEMVNAHGNWIFTPTDERGLIRVRVRFSF